MAGETGGKKLEQDSISKKGESTIAVHGGEIRWRGSITTPLVQTSTFIFKNMNEVAQYTSGKKAHYEYGRYGNPTQEAAETKLAMLEGAETCLLFDCGMSAISATLLALLKTGDHIILTDDAYKQTLNFAENFLPRYGVEVTVIPMGDYEMMESAIKKNTALIFSESPTNPYLNIADMAKVVELGRKYKAVTAIDSTFGAPYNQKPLEWGIDIVIHSGTKFLGGHNDVLSGAVMTSRKFYEKIKLFQKMAGGITDPNSCYLLLRGLKTFSLRMERANTTAMTVATYLEAHPKVKRVYYPGLPSHRHHELAKKQMKGFGGVVTFEVNGNLEQTLHFLDSLKLCLIAPSLGGPESLITHPATITYYSLTREERLDIGVLDELVRLAVGFEDPEDIMADLDQALNSM
ncbi:MAG: aminotransferase class I/II-fold pyridoxal phosphate-dependent enzyme [Candidatus Abyssobacteria bacterium SURF_5]|uniref:Aminotransferase class I/II-fold pyridoxal phosphate-dependent enzyme n=1 Tax=Abyssobacteria bacterium (strain SURF_5) TaxID=2093360 RepID=A0A3A4NTF2_ABYX5|nr:MAG: aminotransferase class I/II-fold pyridoxal phosphate-dependent enzyme [Candidatus Abyssubacteria bacterium SURF_5]